MKAIENFLPQRAPFLFVDEILHADNTKIIGQKYYGSDLKFYDILNNKKIIPSTILIESLMQCGGAGCKILQLTTDKTLAAAAIDAVKIHQIVSIPNTIKMTINNLRIRDKTIYQEGYAWLNDELILSAKWHCIAIKNL